jgi:hypothetical protein
MRIEYVISSDDYVQYYLYIQHRRMDRFRKARWYWPVIALVWVIVAGVGLGVAFAVWKALAIFAFGFRNPDDRIVLGVAAVTAGLAFAIVAYCFGWNVLDNQAFWRQVRRQARKRATFGGYRCGLVLSAAEVLLTVWREWDDEGTAQVFRYEMRVPWAEVESIEECSLHAFMITKTSGIFIPKAAFSDEKAFRSFVEAARQFRAGETTAITATPPDSATQAAVQIKRVP